MKQHHLIAALLAGMFCASQAQAEIAIAADLGTTGVGAHLSVPLQSNLNARLGVGFLNYSYDSSTDDVDYKLKLKLRTFDALLDYFPMDGAFRVSGGVVYNGNKIDAKGKPNKAGSYTLNGNTYTAASAGQLDGTIDFRKVAPYIGIGWGNPVKEAGWGISSDIGVLFQGAPKTALRNSGCAPLVCAALKTDVAAENDKLADKVKDFKAYPVLRISASYRF